MTQGKNLDPALQAKEARLLHQRGDFWGGAYVRSEAGPHPPECPSEARLVRPLPSAGRSERWSLGCAGPGAEPPLVHPTWQPGRHSPNPRQRWRRRALAPPQTAIATTLPYLSPPFAEQSGAASLPGPPSTELASPHGQASLHPAYLLSLAPGHGDTA